MMVRAVMTQRGGIGGGTQHHQHAQDEDRTHCIWSNQAIEGERTRPAPYTGAGKAAGQDRFCGRTGGGCNHPQYKMCACAALAPNRSSFTISHIDGIILGDVRSLQVLQAQRRGACR
jgi:hypothetical protein